MVPCTGCGKRTLGPGPELCDKCHTDRLWKAALLLRRELRANLNVPRLSKPIEDFELWIVSLPPLTKNLVCGAIFHVGIRNTITERDCCVVIELLMYGTYRRRLLLGMAWVGRFVYERLKE
jgi:hypothetical protein